MQVSAGVGEGVAKVVTERILDVTPTTPSTITPSGTAATTNGKE